MLTTSTFTSLAVTALLATSLVNASPHNRFERRGAHHRAIAERSTNIERTLEDIVGDAYTKRNIFPRKFNKRGGKTCRVKEATALTSSSSAAPTSTAAAPITSSQPAETWESSSATPSSTTSDSWGEDWQTQKPAATSSTWEEPAPTTTQAPEQPPIANSGLLHVSGPCGESQPDAEHPNGAVWWLNCGLDSNGWSPPSIQASQLISITDTNQYPEIFGACNQFQSIFADAAGKQNSKLRSTICPWVSSL